MAAASVTVDTRKEKNVQRVFYDCLSMSIWKISMSAPTYVPDCSCLLTEAFILTDIAHVGPEAQALE